MQTSCPVCLEQSVDSLTDQTWDFFGRIYRLALCRSCGSAFTTPLPDDGTLNTLYRNSFDYRWYEDHLAAKLQDSEIRYQEYAPRLGQRVIDFGGGLGYFSQTVRSHGRESVTFDPYVPSGEPQESSWDTVVALHMLEHSNNLDRTCGQIKKLLIPGGRLILAVPNYSGRGYREMGMRWVWAQPPLIHVFHFTAAGLMALLRRHGFGEFEVSYHERWDANLYCDLEHGESFRRRDAAWALRPFNAIPAYRRMVAARNSRRRFAGLEQAMADFDSHSDIYSELEISAILTSK
jgi:SAM-dependent methyltransferase